jgi:hypothetical protein
MLEGVRIGVRLKISALCLHRDRERDGLPLARSAAEGSAAWANIVLPIQCIVSIAIPCIGEKRAYHFFMSIAESAPLGGDRWYAWTGPAREGT